MAFLLDRYLARMFISRFLALLSGLSVLIMFLDLLANADKVLESGGESVTTLLRYAVLRLPEIMSSTTTFAVLLAALLTLGALVRHHELVALRSVGVSQFKLFSMLLPASLLVAVPQFLLDDQVVPRSIHELRVWGVGDYGQDAEGEETSVTWAREGSDIIRVRYVHVGEEILTGVAIFRRSNEGNIVERILADSARYSGEAWTLYGARRFIVADGAIEVSDTLPWEGRIPPSMFASLSAHPRELTWSEMKRFVDDKSLGNRPQYFYETWLYKKITGPVSSILMILIAVPLAQRFHREGALAPMFIIGVAIGFLYFVLEGWSFTTGEVGLLPPVVAAWVPNIIMVAVAGMIAFQFERH